MSQLPRRCDGSYYGHYVPPGVDRCPTCNRWLPGCGPDTSDSIQAQVDRETAGPVREWVKWSDTKGLSFWQRILVFGAAKMMTATAEEQGYNADTGEMASYDWCRFRSYRHCYVPEGYEEAGSSGPLGPPTDRGFCPKESWDDQRACPVSEPGPDAPDPHRRPAHVIPRSAGGATLPRHVTPPWI